MTTVRLREVVSALLTNERGEALLQLRDDKPTIPYPNMWTPFGGQVEPGETPDAAGRRELMEELGLELPLALWHVFPCPVRSKPGEVVCMHYSYFAPLDRPIESLTLSEGQAMAFFGLAQLTSMKLAFGQETLLRDFFAYQARGERAVLR